MRALIVGIITISILLISGCGSGDTVDPLQEKTDIALLQMASSEFEKGNYSRAYEVYDAIDKYYPNTDYYVEVKIGKANVLGRQQKFEEQLDVYLSTLKANVLPQKVPRILTEIGNFYQTFAPYDPGLTGGGTDIDYQRSLEFYKKALEYDESNDVVAKSEAMANIGLVFAKQREYEKAAQAYQMMLDKYPDSPYYYAVSTRLMSISDTKPLLAISPKGEDEEETVEEDTGEQIESSDDQEQEQLETEEIESPADTSGGDS